MFISFSLDVTLTAKGEDGKRAVRNKECNLTVELDPGQFTDQECYIRSADQLKSVGDLSIFKPGTAKFAMATKLQEIKLGDASIINNKVVTKAPGMVDITASYNDQKISKEITLILQE